MAAKSITGLNKKMARMKATIHKEPASSEQSKLESKEEEDKKETPKIVTLLNDLEQIDKNFTILSTMTTLQSTGLLILQA